VNFCKYTNETRLSIEDATQKSGQGYLCAINGPCAGGGYELAMACHEILLIDDGSSAVSLPEVPLLGVLPGTGGLTRLIDKRKVRRDRADVFATLAEGIRGKRAVEWGLVDEIAARSRFAEKVAARAQAMATARAGKRLPGEGIELEPLDPTVTADGVKYKFVELTIESQGGARRQATLTIAGPTAAPPTSIADLTAQAKAGELWALRAFRELDDALLRLRFHETTVGLIILRTRGDGALLARTDEALLALRDHHLPAEIALLQARVLRRLDQTARSFFAVVEPTSCFAGSLLELLLAADRSYVLEDGNVSMRLSTANRGAMAMYDGSTRLMTRYCGRDALAEAVLAHDGAIDATTADKLGLCTVLADDIDFEDTLRVAIEERLSLSPDALTGLEQNLRAVGGGREGMEQRIFGRLSAWQNWIFIRGNATGPRGALTSYGKPERPVFDWNRT
jgi:benzoyl-CoA-dihydrodiol lyase